MRFSRLLYRYSPQGSGNLFLNKSLEGHEDMIWDLHVKRCEDKPLLFSAGADGTVKAWDVRLVAPTTFAPCSDACFVRS